jgi:hypothetical protein
MGSAGKREFITAGALRLATVPWLDKLALALTGEH